MLIAKLRTIAGLGHDRSGMAATEFALILPLMLTLYFGVTEVTDALIANTKTAALASTAADLTAQNDKLCDAEMNDIFATLNAIMFPYPATGTRIVISSLVEDGTGAVKVAWSSAQNGTPRTTGSSVSIPTGLVTVGSGSGIILTEISYTYTSPAGQLIYGSVSMNDTFYTHPRRTKTVTRTTSTCT
jgi:Flp pilus assembly protein TadG